MRDEGRKKMKVLPDFEKRNALTKEFNRLVDERDAAWVAEEDVYFEEEPGRRAAGLLTINEAKRADKAIEKLSALIGEASKTDPELAEQLYRRERERFRLRPRGEKARRYQQAMIEQQACKCFGCEGPLDVNQQMLFSPPYMLCDFCCEEELSAGRKYGEEVA
jgi:hypothetical protein